VRRLTAQTWVLVAALLAFLAVLCWLRAARAELGDPLPGCVPAWAVLDPDETQVHSYQFAVVIRETTLVVRWRWDYVFKDKACCRSHLNAVRDVVTRLPEIRGLVHLDDDCR
jgi:hypothetical protein